MAIDFPCKACAQELHAPDTLVGKAFKCKHCGRAQVVPRASAAFDSAHSSARTSAPNADAFPLNPPAPATGPHTAPAPLRPPYETAAHESFAQYFIRPASGTGDTAGKGRRLKLRRPIQLEFGPIGVTVYGRTQRFGRTLLALAVAAALTVLTAGIVAWFMEARWLLYSAPAFVAYYVATAAIVGRMEYEDLKMSKHGHVAFHDRRKWLSVEIYHDEWFTFVPVRGAWSWRPDRLAYKEIKARLTEIAGARMRGR